MISQNELKEIISYNPVNGIFRWKKNHLQRKKGHIIKARPNSKGYPQIRINGKEYLCSRLAFLYVEGVFPEYFLHIKNGKPSDLRWDNIQHMTPSCKIQKMGIYKNNKTGVKGVRFDERYKLYMVHVKSKYVGCSKDFEVAVKIRYKAELENFSKECNNSSAYKYLKERNLLKDIDKFVIPKIKHYNYGESKLKILRGIRQIGDTFSFTFYKRNRYYIGSFKNLNDALLVKYHFFKKFKNIELEIDKEILKCYKEEDFKKYEERYLNRLKEK